MDKHRVGPPYWTRTPLRGLPPRPVDRDSSSVKPRLVTRSGSRPREHASKNVPLKIKLPGLTLGEVEATIMQSKSDKAPGLDEITFRVWKKLWPALGSVVLKLYQASLALEYVSSGGVQPR